MSAALSAGFDRLILGSSVPVSVSACVHACVRACVRACVCVYLYLLRGGALLGLGDGGVVLRLDWLLELRGGCVRHLLLLGCLGCLPRRHLTDTGERQTEMSVFAMLAARYGCICRPVWARMPLLQDSLEEEFSGLDNNVRRTLISFKWHKRGIVHSG